MKVVVDYPDFGEEQEILKRTTGQEENAVEPALSGPGIGGRRWPLHHVTAHISGWLPSRNAVRVDPECLTAST